MAFTVIDNDYYCYYYYCCYGSEAPDVLDVGTRGVRRGHGFEYMITCTGWYGYNGR